MGTRALALSLLLVPSLALAQTAGQATLLITDRTAFDTTQINRAECASTATSVTVSYLPSMIGTFTANSDIYRFFASTSACSSTVPSSGSFALDQTATANTSVQTVDVSGNAIAAALGLSCTQATDTTYYLCIYLTKSDATTVVGTAFSGALTFQLAVPPPPAITGVAPGNGALEVTVAQGAVTSTEKADTGITFQAVASATGQATVTAPSSPTTNTTIRVDGLVDNVTYTVVAYAYSTAGNKSAASASATGTPLPFESFWWAYQNAGGREQGGCGGGAGALAPLALLPLALRLRRRRS
jgi:hypothetical protein